MLAMRLLLAVALLAPVAMVAQDQAPPAEHHEHPAPKNLKLLDAKDLMPTMRFFRESLGVKCSFCHVEGDFASDENPHKNVARKMIELARDINSKFPDGGAEQHVTCYTCHRGSEHPATQPPSESK